MIKPNPVFLAKEAEKKFVDKKWTCIKYAADSILNVYAFQGETRSSLYKEIVKLLEIRKREVLPSTNVSTQTRQIVEPQKRFVITPQMRQEAALLEEQYREAGAVDVD